MFGPNTMKNLNRALERQAKFDAHQKIEELTRQRDALVKAGKELIERWDTLDRKGLPPTQKYIDALRTAIADAEKGETK